MIPFNTQDFEVAFRELAFALPLEIFAFAGSLIEEIVSPIPGYLVMGIVGSVAFAQKVRPEYLFILTLLGALGKTLGSALWYLVGDTLEDVLRGTISRLFRVSPEKIENFGKRFTGAHWKDGGSIFLLRVFPLTPTIPFSIACGILKINFTVYLVASFLGNFLKDIFYIAAGYYGVANLIRLRDNIHWYKVELEWVLFLVGVGVLITFFFQSDIWKSQKQKFKRWKKSFDE